MANDFEYSRGDAVQILAGCAGLLLPLIRGNQVAGCDWPTNAWRIVESESDDVKMALLQLYKLSRDRSNWLDYNVIQRESGINGDEMTLLTGLLPVYRVKRMKQMHAEGEAV